MRKNNNRSPKQKARQRFNKMVNYCENPYAKCTSYRCDADKCGELLKQNVRPGAGVLYDQLDKEQRQIVVAILGGVAK